MLETHPLMVYLPPPFFTHLAATSPAIAAVRIEGSETNS